MPCHLLVLFPKHFTHLPILMQYISGVGRVLTIRAFLSKLRKRLQALGYSPQDYAGHFFRRRGASFAYQSGVPLELIKMLDDWKSDSVLLYLTAPHNIRLQTINLISRSILTDTEAS